MPARLNLLGQTFGRLAVISCGGSDERGAVLWLCNCTCGNEKSARGSDLKRGSILSCGCWNSERTAGKNRSHGYSHTRLYRIWQAMHDRTSNPNASNYRYYGGRGIKVCASWTDFEPFLSWAISNGYREDLSIDRYPDNDGNYEPGNCRWATQSQQVRNSRRCKQPLENYHENT